uniref:Neuroendocrine protein 7B2 n=1 Tax=Romanomermis culicivorax TaxID=13658 RepID=A0A915L9H6_ROMCU
MLIKPFYDHVILYFSIIVLYWVGGISTLSHHGDPAAAVDAFWKLGDVAAVTPAILDGEVVANNFVQNGNDFYKDSSLRDVEHLEHSSLWGHKYMGGGAGEGKQFLSPTGIFENKHEIKTDAVLPAYCDPPNPCPVGATADDGCLEEFENTAEFSRHYQANQDCLCDEDHMFACPAHHRKPSESLAEASDVEFQSFLDNLLNKATPYLN